MKKDIYIVGAGGFGREVAWLIEELEMWNIVGFIDDTPEKQRTTINDYLVIGNLKFLTNLKQEANVVIAVANPAGREGIYNKLKSNKNISFPNLIAKNVKLSKWISLGMGNIICSNSVVTTNIEIGSFNHINLNCTIGHDVVMKNFVTIYPSASISGNVIINNNCEIGTGARVIQKKCIAKNVIVGAGTIVIKDLLQSGTYVGSPAKKIK